MISLARLRRTIGTATAVAVTFLLATSLQLAVAALNTRTKPILLSPRTFLTIPRQPTRSCIFFGHFNLLSDDRAGGRS